MPFLIHVRCYNLLLYFESTDTHEQNKWNNIQVWYCQKLCGYYCYWTFMEGSCVLWDDLDDQNEVSSLGNLAEVNSLLLSIAAWVPGGWPVTHILHEYWPLIGWGWSHDQDTGLPMANSDSYPFMSLIVRKNGIKTIFGAHLTHFLNCLSKTGGRG